MKYVRDMENIIIDPPRMGDFAIWGAAVIKAVGLDYNEFLEQYTSHIKELISERTELDDFVMALKQFLTDHGNQWKGKPNDLLAGINEIAIRYRFTIERFTASTLSRKLNTMKTNLRAARIEVIRGRESKRYIELLQKCDEQDMCYEQVPLYQCKTGISVSA